MTHHGLVGLCVVWACFNAFGVNAASLKFVDASYDHLLVGNIQTDSLREASGLAHSIGNNSVLWSHNDSGYGPYLFALNVKGDLLARFFIQGASSRDWEDIASFSWKGKPWLAIADTGNNDARKPFSSIHLLVEPDVASNVNRKVQRVNSQHTIRFAFPEGPADCESIAVDTQHQRIYLLTKRQVPPRLYSLPLPTDDDDSDQLVMATFEGTIAALPKPSLQELIDFPTFGLHRSQPTAMDFSPDHTFAVINTYGYSYRYERRSEMSWIEAFRSQAQRISVPFRQQGEAIAIGPDNRSLYFTSEGRKPPIYKLTPRAQEAPESVESQ